MLMYRCCMSIYIDEKDEEALKGLCRINDLELEEDHSPILNDPDYQESLRRETGFSGVIKRFYVTYRTTNLYARLDLFRAMESADFDLLISEEIS